MHCRQIFSYLCGVILVANATVFAYANVVKLRRRGGLTLERNLRTLFTAPFAFLRIDGQKKLSNGITNMTFTITYAPYYYFIDLFL